LAAKRYATVELPSAGAYRLGASGAIPYNRTGAALSLWIHLSQKDNKLSTTSRPMQIEAKARDFCP